LGLRFCVARARRTFVVRVFSVLPHIGEHVLRFGAVATKGAPQIEHWRSRPRALYAGMMMAGFSSTSVFHQSDVLPVVCEYERVAVGVVGVGFE